MKQQVIDILDRHIKRLNGSSTLEDIREEIINLEFDPKILEIVDKLAKQAEEISESYELPIASRWIPVSEMLPDKPWQYIVVDDWCVTTQFFILWDWAYRWWSITHYQPLPLPPNQ